MNHTVFGDLRQRAHKVYRVKTRSSSYVIGFHELRGRKVVIMRGEPGTDRQHVVVRDSDPRVGEHSMFELPITEWAGKALEVGMMTSSTIEAVVVESDPEAIAAVGIDGRLDQQSPWARPVGPSASGPVFKATPPGMSDTPRIVPLPGRGTLPLSGESLPHGMAAHGGVAHQVVVGLQPGAAPEPEIPYPERHVRYAESVASLLRSISRRDRLYEDTDKTARDRLRRALDDSATLLEQIRRRDRR